MFFWNTVYVKLHTYKKSTCALCCCRGMFGQRMYKTDHKLITVINNVQSSWTARHYEMFEDMTVDEVIAMAGGRALRYSPSVTVHCHSLIYTADVSEF